MGSIKFRLADPPPTRWMGACAVIGRVVPCCRSRWGLFSENLGPPLSLALLIIELNLDIR